MIETTRLKLNELEDGDFDSFVKLQTDTKTREYLGGPVEPLSLKSKFQEAMKTSKSEINWVARNSESNFIGLVTLSTHINNQDTEISYQFLPEFWGQGFALEAVRAVLDYAFVELKISKVIAETQTKNLKSRKLLEKLNMKPLQTLERFGEHQVIYTILNY